MSQFKHTYNLYKNYIATMTTEEPLSYETWASLPRDYRTPALFVNFFDQISLAWFKLRTDAAVEEECVEEVIQYLWKNEPIIMRDKKRYTPANIYRVVSNCLYCKSIDPYAGQTAKNSWYNNVQSNVMVFDEDETDLFDMMPASPFSSKLEESDGWKHTDMYEVCESSARRIAFEKAGIWKTIFGELDHMETVKKKHKKQRDSVAIDITIEVDEKQLRKLLTHYGYTVVKRADNARYIISDSDIKTKLLIDADRFQKPVFSSKEFMKYYCKGETQEEYEIEVPVYSGGMDKDVQQIVKYLMGEEVKLDKSTIDKIPEVKEIIRQLILSNAEAFEFVGIDTSKEF